jgi:hypothetical protein
MLVHALELRKPCLEVPTGAWKSLHGGSRKWFPEQSADPSLEKRVRAWRPGYIWVVALARAKPAVFASALGGFRREGGDGRPGSLAGLSVLASGLGCRRRLRVGKPGPRYLLVEGGRIGQRGRAWPGPGLDLGLLHDCFLSLVRTRSGSGRRHRPRLAIGCPSGCTAYEKCP